MFEQFVRIYFGGRASIKKMSEIVCLVLCFGVWAWTLPENVSRVHVLWSRLSNKNTQIGELEKRTLERKLNQRTITSEIHHQHQYSASKLSPELLNFQQGPLN